MRTRLAGLVDPKAVISLEEWTPEITPGTLYLWYEVRKEIGLSDTDPVTTLTDWSGGNWHAAEASFDTSDDQTIYHANSGFPYIQFSDASTGGVYLRNADFDVVTTQPFTMIVVGNIAYERTLGGIGVADCDQNLYTNYDHAIIWCSDISHDNFAETPTIMMYTYDGSTLSIYEGSAIGITLLGSGAADLDIAQGLSLGAFQDGGGHFENARFYGMVVIGGVLNPDKLTLAAEYFANLIS